MRILAAILLAVACGLIIGSGTAELRIRQHPWLAGGGVPPPASSVSAVVDQQEYDFGKLDAREEGSHEFVLTNRGDRTLTLHEGARSCACTVGEIQDNELAPHHSTKVVVTWRSKGRIGPFQQSVTITTTDPARPEITLTIKGEYTRSVYADPDEIAFGQISGTEPITREARILCSLPDEKIKVERYEITTDLGMEKFVGVEIQPMAERELLKYKGVTSGVLVRVTVKSGLPLGPFQPRIKVSTNLAAAPEIDLPVFGSVGEVTIVGAGWSGETGVLDIGPVDGRSATQRLLLVVARGPEAKEMSFKVASLEPDYLNAKLGKRTVTSTGPVTTELSIEIPPCKTLKKKAATDFMGGENRKLGEIILETTGPKVRALRIRVRFKVLEGT